MPTFNQLVRQVVRLKKSKAPALLKGLNSKKNVMTDVQSPQSGVCTAVKTATPKPNSALRKIA